MDSIIDVVGRENIAAREVILYPEGIFYRAYGFSALRFIRSLRPYQAKKRHYKKLGAEVCYLGFPQAALDGLLPEGFKAETTAEGTVVVSGPFGALTQQEYDEWVRSIPLSVSKPRSPVSDSGDVSASGGAFVGGGTQETDASFPARDVPQEGVAGSASAAEREVLRRLHGFALEAATPLECMLFLSELKKRLNGE